MNEELIVNRLIELETEHKKGIDRLNQLQAEIQNTNQTVLRIEGAISLCNELLKKEGDEPK